MVQRSVIEMSLSVFLVLFLFSSTAHSRQATVTEANQVFRTYPFGDPDPVAKMTNIYPYFRFEGYSVRPVDREWRVVTLENPYIKVMIAPGIGGKILGAFDKSTGRAFIYFNRVVKFREIAMRGPWTSGGIEFNFGDIGHTPSTATPVDYTTRTNEDGSVSCIVGALGLPSRTEWRVEIRLPKDKAYFETESFWYNPTDLSTSLYHWMNAAADATPDLRFIYPGTGYIDHGGGAYPWPIDTTGRDISRYANNAFGSSKSYHVLGAYTDTYAAYWANDNFGVVHWSPYADKPGKKIWIWSLSRDGEIWKDLLSDADLGNNQYVEIQSGLLFNQAGGGSSQTPFKHEFFAPGSEENFVEAWFPFKNIGGLAEANLSGSLNVQRVGRMLKIGFCPLGKTLQPFIVTRGGKEIYRKDLSLLPLEVFVDSLTLTGQGEIEVSVGDLISYRPEDAEARKLHRPLTTKSEFDWSGVGGLYTDGAELAKQRNYKGALEKYLACLTKDPTYTPALSGAAEVYYRRIELAKALEYARRALANDAYDADANFIYGVVNKKLGNLYDALDGFGAAARSMKYRSAANAEMAEVSLLQKKWPAAEAYAFRSLDYDRSNVRASRLLPVLYRMQGNVEGAKNGMAHLHRIDPLSHLAAFETYLIDTTAEALARFKSMIRNELPHESYLELASYYFGLHRYEEAIKVLGQAPTHPIVSYWLAYLNHFENRRHKAEEYLAEAVELSPALVYPFRLETVEILKWAEEMKPHWKTKYYLALAYWSKDKEDVATDLMISCGTVPNYAPFYLTRGNLRRPVEPLEALKDYKHALELGRTEWRTYRALIDYYVEHTQYAEALAIARSAVDVFPSSYVALFNLARSLVLNRQPEASLAILDTLIVLPFEGARYSRDVYRQACILSAAEAMKAEKFSDAGMLLKKARQWPERLGVGRPNDVDNRLEDYLEALCFRKQGQTDLARKLYGQVVAYSRSHQSNRGVNRLFGALAERAEGKEEAETRLIEERSGREVSTDWRWCSFVFRGKITEALELQQQLRGSSNASLLGRTTIDQEFALVAEVYLLYHF